MLNFRKYGCAIVAALLMVSCTAGLGGARLLSEESPESVKMRGILDLANDCDNTKKQNDCDVHVFFTHGIGLTPKTFDENLIEYLERQFHTTRISFLDTSTGVPVRFPNRLSNNVVRGEAVPCKTKGGCQPFTELGELRTTKIPLQYKGKSIRVFVHSYYWHEALWGRLQLPYMRSDVEGLDGVWINNSLKQNIMNYGFSDATLYVGDMGKIMRIGMETAICMTIRNALQNSGEQPCDLADFTENISEIKELKIALVAKSLGSRILLDSLMPRNQLDELQQQAILNGRNAPINFLNENHQVRVIKVKTAIAQSKSNIYMLANQFPLLGLGAIQVASKTDMKLRDKIYCKYVAPGETCGFTPMFIRPDSGTVSAPQSAFEQFANHSYEKNRQNKEDDVHLEKEDYVHLYAFRDPNDILGYRAAAHMSSEAGSAIKFVEITHRNAYEWALSFANPKSAHANEDGRKTSLALIWCGGVGKKNRRLIGNKCK